MPENHLARTVATVLCMLLHYAVTATDAQEPRNGALSPERAIAPDAAILDPNYEPGFLEDASSETRVESSVGDDLSIPLPPLDFATTQQLPSDMVSSRFSESDALSSGLNFNEFPKDFTSGITIRQGRWGVKFGGYVKADLIHDFHAIDSTDLFDPATIPTDVQDRTDSRFHARQTRLNMDARWITEAGDPLRMMVEGDFFGPGDTIRLRHAFGEYKGWIIGQTWTTFTHRAALPNTLDVVGDVASVGRRQAQVRYSRHFLDDRFVFSGAVEDSTVGVEDDLLTLGVPRSPMPDFIARLRYRGDDAEIQLAGVVRQLGFQPLNSNVITRFGSGLNATSFVDLTSRSRLYGGILWGSGIGNYRDLPDIALTGPQSGSILKSLAWYSGVTHQWTKSWSSNLTYSQGDVDNTSFQSTGSIRRLQYMAANLIWQPTPYTFVGSEFLWGKRIDRNLSSDDASRFMVSFGFLLP
jgi:hypothetical protein